MEPAEEETKQNKHVVDESQPEDPMLFCPVCSARLLSRKCKLICERCGYFMSCADYY